MSAARVFRHVLACAGLVCIAVAGAWSPAQAARPLLDQHQWDRAFALFARDSNVPWRTTTVRLETYSSAPVDFRAFAVDAPDVIVAGRPQGRVYDTQGHTPVAHWRFRPPAGYRVEGNTVPLPLGEREGLFVIEARRGAAVEQVWVNRSRVGLLSKESPGGLIVYGTDLSTGKPITNLRLLFLVGSHLEKRMTAANGIVRWNGAQRPRFVLAEWGHSRAFLSFLPQAPPPPALAVVRVDRAVIRGGDDLNIVGFARRRVGPHFVSAAGTAQITLLFHGRPLAATSSELDSAGAFHVRLHVPSVTTGGTAAVLVDAGGASAGTGVQIDAAGDVTLTVAPECGTTCAPNRPVPLLFEAKRLGAAAVHESIAVRVVRYPHIFPPGTSESSKESWAATTLVAANLSTNENGRLRVVVPAAADGLPSTLGIAAQTLGNSASASTRLELPNSAAALEVRPDHDTIDVGQSVGVDVHAFVADDGRPLIGNVSVALSHGPNRSVVNVRLDANGRGRAVFHRPQYGTNLILAHLQSPRGEALDANSVTLAPRALSVDVKHGATIAVRTDRNRYALGSKVQIAAPAHDAIGSALVSIDNRLISQPASLPILHGEVRGSIPLGDPQGAVKASVAYVHAGYLVQGETPLQIDGPGHERRLDLHADANVTTAGSDAHIVIADGSSNEIATTIIRLTDELPSGGADFDSAGDVLNFGGATTQSSASDDPPWHAWVSPLHSRARDLFTDINRRPSTTSAPSLSDAASHVLLWRAERSGTTVTVPLPKTPGKYMLSILRMYDDGDVGASTLTLVVS